MLRHILIALVFCLPSHLSHLAKLEAAEPMANPKTSAYQSINWYRPDKWQSLGSLGFRIEELPDDTFVMIFPEWITAREKSWHVPLKWQLSENEATGTWEEDDCKLELVLTYSNEQSPALAWKYEFHNGSENALTDLAAFNCFNLVDAPSFKDLNMERTWVGNGHNRSDRLANVKKTKGPRTLQFYPAKAGLNLPEFERFTRYGANSPQQLSGDRIGVLSKDENWSVQCIVEGPVAYFFNNWEADHGCVHAAPLLGNIAPGESATAQGKIVFTKEKPVK